VAKLINERFDDYDYVYDLGEIDVKMSGCMNACGHHHVGNIGILGVDKGGEEWYQITIGGAAGADASLGSHRSVRAKARAAETIARLLEVYVEQRDPRSVSSTPCAASASSPSRKESMPRRLLRDGRDRRRRVALPGRSRCRRGRAADRDAWPSGSLEPRYCGLHAARHWAWCWRPLIAR
jgi:hypothetical protein